MLDAAASAFAVEPAPPLPVEAMMRGKTCAEVADLLPRVFNLCRTAQELAARRALGLSVAENTDALRGEIIRDHVLRLSLVLPGHFGQAPAALPRGWQSGSHDLRKTLFGRAGTLPARPGDLEAYLSGGSFLGGLWSRVRDMFAPGEAVCTALPPVTPKTAEDPKARVENSPALRVLDHPVPVAVERTCGRGPLWRVVARSYDLLAQLDGAPLQVTAPSPGVAHVAATRGLYTVRAKVAGGRVQALRRVTPTDHLQAPGGMLDQTLASLPAGRAGLLPLLMDIMDPCTPLRVRGVAHA